jgi:hypothetical protein
MSSIEPKISAPRFIKVVSILPMKIEPKSIARMDFDYNFSNRFLYV